MEKSVRVNRARHGMARQDKARLCEVRQGKDFSADRHSSAGQSRAGQPEARILAMNGNAMQGNACLGDANKAKARIFNLRGVNK